jgi:hypothetical protein
VRSLKNPRSLEPGSVNGRDEWNEALATFAIEIDWEERPLSHAWDFKNYEVIGNIY